jgi:hypothetical protein
MNARAEQIRLMAAASTLEEVIAAQKFADLRQYLVLTVTGIESVALFPSRRRLVLGHWRAVARLVGHGQADDLAGFGGVRVWAAGPVLEADPRRVLAAHHRGLFLLPVSPGDPMPWEVS